MESKIKGEVIGIDLGTTYSCVAVWQSSTDGVTIIPNEQGKTITPSYVAFDGFERLVGNAAKNLSDINPAYSIFDVKRLIGRRLFDPCVKEDMSLWPFKVVPDFQGNPMIEVINMEMKKKKLVTPEEISSIILKKMKNIAEVFLGRKVSHAVITVPATFNDSQRQATKNAGLIAGLNVIKIINEPSAIAITYDLHKKASMTGEQNVLVFNFGGGTCEATLLKIDSEQFLVQATAGDTHLGGRDIDNCLVNHIVTSLKEQHKKDISNNARAISQLRSHCENVKRILSSRTEAMLGIESFCDGKDIVMKINRAQFEELNMDLFNKCINLVERCLQDSKVDKSQVHEVILVGGSTRIPKVQELLRDFFQMKQLCESLHPNEAVAAGAALYAANITEKINKNKNLVLVDVTSLSLGIQTTGGIMTIFIPRNTPVPAREEMMFTTCEDNQTSALIQVYEGERPQAKDNNLLGEFELTDIPPAPRGVPQITIIYEIDSNGILNVSAKEKNAGVEKIHRITNKSRLSKEEIRKMVEEAERFKSEDEKVKKKVEAKSLLENYAYEVLDAIKDLKISGGLNPAHELEMKDAIEVTLEWVDKNQGLTAEQLDTRRKELEDLCTPIIGELIEPANANFDLYVYSDPEINYVVESSTPNIEEVD